MDAVNIWLYGVMVNIYKKDMREKEILDGHEEFGEVVNADLEEGIRCAKRIEE